MSPVRRFVFALALVAVVVVGAGETVARLWLIDGGSMEPQIQDGSVLLVDALGPHMTGYQRGDVVILRAPRAAAAEVPEPFLVKRVVAVGGEEVRIAGGEVYVNGRRLDEPYLPPGTTTEAGDAGAELDETVPPGDVFVLGDRRWNSLDSKAFGPVPASSLVGRVWLIVGRGGPAVPHSSPYPAAAAVRP